jgi:hypothetical protein
MLRCTLIACIVILYCVYLFSPRIKTNSCILLAFLVNKTQLPTCWIIYTWSTAIRKTLLYIMGMVDILIYRRCGTEKETSARVSCECEALATLRHTYFLSFFLDPKKVRRQSGTLLKE